MAYEVDEKGAAAEQKRHGVLEAVFDAGTTRSFETTGIAEGWRCLDVGTGGGSVAVSTRGRVPR